MENWLQKMEDQILRARCRNLLIIFYAIRKISVNMIIEHKGGISFVNDDSQLILPLPVGGLMSQEDGYKVAEQYSLIDKAVKYAGSTLASPFMTLSFMALLVIPHLKLSDLGLFDGDRFAFAEGKVRGKASSC